MLTMLPDPKSYDVALQLNYLRDFKESFLQSDFLAALMATLNNAMNFDSDLSELDENGEHSERLVELLLSLLRNVLLIPDPPQSPLQT